MRKIFLIAIFLILLRVSVYAEQNYSFDFISENQIKTSESNVDVSGELPVMDKNKFKSKVFADSINQKIEKLYTKRLKSAKDNKSKSLRVSYNVKARKNIVSLLIYFTETQKYIDTINFNLQTLKFVTIKDILGQNAVAVANKVIRDTTINSVSKYDSDFPGIDETHDFYLEENNLVIVLDEYELSPTLKGLQKFNIKIDCLINKILKKDDYYIAKPYNLKMIPIKDVCKTFGYRVIWNVTFYSVQVVKDDLNILGFVDRNIYTRNKEPSRTLESAIKIRDGKAYAPISFFTEYIDLIYSAVDDGTIVFSQYTDTKEVS